MKPIVIGIAVVAVLAVLGALYIAATYNGMLSDEIDVERAWSDVETEYQRQHEVIPNMITTAEASMKFQVKLTSGYAEAREDLKAANQLYNEAYNDPNGMDSVQKMDRALKEAQSSFKFLVNARSESVPEANVDQLTELNNEMSAIQNVIANQRQEYNQAVAKYNKKILRFPNFFFASMFGFEEKPLFEAEKGIEKMPEVEIEI